MAKKSSSQFDSSTRRGMREESRMHYTSPNAAEMLADIADEVGQLGGVAKEAADELDALIPSMKRLREGKPDIDGTTLDPDALKREADRQRSEVMSLAQDFVESLKENQQDLGREWADVLEGERKGIEDTLRAFEREYKKTFEEMKAEKDPTLADTMNDPAGTIAKGIEDGNGKLASMGAAIGLIKTLVSSIEANVNKTRDMTRELAVAYHESYEQAKQQEDEIISTIKEMGIDNIVTGPEVSKILTDYGKSYTLGMSQETAALAAAVEKNTDMTAGQFSQIYRLMRARGASDEEVQSYLEHLNALDKLGMDVSSILDIQSKYSDFLTGEDSAQLGELVSYLEDQGIGTEDIDKIAQAVGNMDFEPVRDILANASDESRQALTESVLSGKMMSNEDIVKLLQSAYGNAYAVNNQYARSAGFGQGTAQAWANFDVGAFQSYSPTASAGEEIDLAGTSANAEFENTVTNELGTISNTLGNILEQIPGLGKAIDVGKNIGIGAIGMGLAKKVVGGTAAKGAAAAGEAVAGTAAAETTAAAGTAAAETVAGSTAAETAAAGGTSVASTVGGALGSVVGALGAVGTGITAGLAGVFGYAMAHPNKKGELQSLANGTQWAVVDKDGAVIPADVIDTGGKAGKYDGYTIYDSKNEATKASEKINGSHASGLNSVPYDGYVAELHQGERVLTKSDAEAQDKLYKMVKEINDMLEKWPQYFGGKLDKIADKETNFEYIDMGSRTSMSTSKY